MAITQTDSLAVAKIAAATELAFSTLKPLTTEYTSSGNRAVFLEVLRRYIEAYEVVDTAISNAQSAREILDRIKSSESTGQSGT